MRKFVLNTLLATSLMASLALVGCSGSGDDDTSSPTPKPSPTPSPTPTAPPFDDWFRVSSLAVGNSTQGVDIDGDMGGDSSVDNTIEDTLGLISDNIYAAVEEAVCGTEECTGTDKQAMVIVGQVLEAVFSVESLSAAIGAPVSAGVVNYLPNFTEETKGGNIKLSYWSGEAATTGYTKDKNLGEADGKLSGTAGLWGPGDIIFSVYFDSPVPNSDPLEASFPLHHAFTKVDKYDHAALNPFYIGGGVAVADLMTIVGLVLDALAGVVPEESAPDWDAIYTGVEEVLMANYDIDYNGSSSGGEAFSIGLVAGAETTVVQ